MSRPIIDQEQRLTIRRRPRVVWPLILAFVASCLLVTSLAGPASAAPAAPALSAVPGAVQMQPSECQGTPGAPNDATIRGIKYVEVHSWTICFGAVSEITAYLELQRFVPTGPGGAGTYETVAGPIEKHFPGVTGERQYSSGAAKCSAVGGNGFFRTAAWATWLDNQGEEGKTTTAYAYPNHGLC